MRNTAAITTPCQRKTDKAGQRESINTTKNIEGQGHTQSHLQGQDPGQGHLKGVILKVSLNEKKMNKRCPRSVVVIHLQTFNFSVDYRY